jgi:hypothetical protein
MMMMMMMMMVMMITPILAGRVAGMGHPGYVNIEYRVMMRVSNDDDHSYSSRACCGLGTPRVCEHRIMMRVSNDDDDSYPSRACCGHGTPRVCEYRMMMMITPILAGRVAGMGHPGYHVGLP